MNKIIAMGNLGHSASVRTVAGPRGSQSVVNFSLAVKTGYGDNEQTLWYGCSWWGERAEKVAQWMTKGRRVLVEGEPGLRLYEKNAGGTAAEIVVRVQSVTLLDGGPGKAEGETPAGSAAPDTSVAKKPAADKLDEDVPF